jgi:hypothetical protein
MLQRPLGDMLTEVLGAVSVVGQQTSAVRTKRLELTLPIEVSLQEVDGEITFIADLPGWRWRTIFDRRPSSINIVYEESES